MKRRTDRQQNVWKLVDDGGGDWLVAVLVIVMAITAFFGSMVYFLLVTDQNDIRESQFEYVHMLEAANYGTAAQAEYGVKTVATSIVLAKNWGTESRGLGDAQFVEALVTASQTGSVPEPTVEKATWDDYGQVWIPIWLVSLVILGCVGLSFCYVRETFERKEYLADLRWSNPSTIAFAALAVPLLPAFAVSRARMAWNAERDEDEARARVKARAEKKNAKEQPPEFESDHDGALNAYRLARNVATAENIESRKADLTEEIEDLTTEGTELSTRMRDVQQQRTIARASLIELKELVIDPLNSIDDNQIAVEFNRLIAFKGVKYVRPYDKDGLRMFVEARIEHEGVLYDLGDWDLYITRTNVRATILRSSVRDDWDVCTHPSYRYHDGRFCFGDHMRELRDHAVRGQILEAVSAAVRCLNSVSEGDEELIPKAFEPVKKEMNDAATASDTQGDDSVGSAADR